MTDTDKQWHVTLRVWEVWEANVQASSQMDAEERAAELWTVAGNEGWECVDTGIESVSAEEEE